MEISESGEGDDLGDIAQGSLGRARGGRALVEPEEDLGPLRAFGLDDRAILHVITTIAAQNVLSRLRLGLADSR